jgi:hypothetical protein
MKAFRVGAIVLGVGLTTLFLAGRAANAGGLVVYVGGLDRKFGTLDLTNPANITFSQLGTTGQVFAGMGFGADGSLYGLDGDFVNSHLRRISTADASTMDLGAIGQTSVGATTDPTGTKVYSIDQNTPGLLYSVTPLSPVSTPIGTTGIASDGLMAFSQGGALYTSILGAPNNDTLGLVNITTGATTPIGSGMGAFIFAGAFLDGTLYGFSMDLKVYTINTSTGTGTLYGSYSLGPNDPNWITAAAVPLAPAAVPEPTTLSLASVGVVLMGLAGMVWKARSTGTIPTCSERARIAVPEPRIAG